MSRFLVLSWTLIPSGTPFPRIPLSVMGLLQPITNHPADHSHLNSNHHHLLNSVYILVCLVKVFVKYCHCSVSAYQAVCFPHYCSVSGLALFSPITDSRSCFGFVVLCMGFLWLQPSPVFSTLLSPTPMHCVWLFWLLTWSGVNPAHLHLNLPG